MSKDKLFALSNDLLQTQKELNRTKTERDAYARQILELREIIAKLTKSQPNT